MEGGTSMGEIGSIATGVISGNLDTAATFAIALVLGIVAIKVVIKLINRAAGK
jgi:hypothetical protein